jgi:hypothetical protein
VKNPLEFDLTSYLPALTVSPGQKAITVRLDCEGLSMGPPPAFVYLGSATGTIDPSKPNAPLTLIGDQFKLTANLPILSPAIRALMLEQLVPTPFIYPATDVAVTTSPAVCGSHNGGILCLGAFTSHMLVLVWDWSSQDTYQDVNHPQKQYDVIKNIDGFHVYENDFFFQHTLVMPTSLGGAVTTTFFNLPPKPSTFSSLFLTTFGANRPRCFVVRAYKGDVESTDSDPACLSGDPPAGTQTIPLNPSRLGRAGNHYSRFKLSVSTCTEKANTLQPGTETTVGYQHIDDDCYHDNVALRGLVQFDPNDFTHGPVASAILKFRLLGTTFGDNVDGDDPNRKIVPIHDESTLSCARELWTATGDWSKGDYSYPGQNVNTLVSGDFLLDLEPNQIDFTKDVTSAVRAWQADPGTNRGFVLKGYNEDTGAEDNDVCMSNYGNFELDLTFFPQ